MPGKVGLTGGIGSGKSTVASLFEKLGAEVISADSVAREVSENGTVEFNLIVDFFGHEILDKSGRLDRTKLADIVFLDSDKRQRLESILHPPIREIMQKRCDQSETDYCIMEIPLLIETGQWKEMDRVLVVTCSEHIRLRRLQTGRGMDRKRIQAILDTQLTDSERVKFADDILRNDGGLEDLKQRVLSLHRVYLDLFSPVGN